MSRLFGIFNDDDDDKKKDADEGTLRLRKEELDITKNKVRTGEVEISKEIIEETETIDVPVTHEEVIIERRAINNEASDSPIGDEEIIHIPVSEEKVEVDKHTVVTGEISAYKREVEETEHVEETLKREEARVNKTGDADIVSDDTVSSFH